MAISISFPFSWVAQLGAWGPDSLGAGFLYSILSLTGLVSKLQLLNRGPEGLLCRVLPFSTASCLQLTDFLSSPSYIIVQRPLLLDGVTMALIQPIHGQGYNSDITRPDAPVIYTGAFPILTARPGRRSIYNNLIEIFEIINGISNHGRHFFNISQRIYFQDRF